jgi:hypothetical protein
MPFGIMFGDNDSFKMQGQWKIWWKVLFASGSCGTRRIPSLNHGLSAGRNLFTSFRGKRRRAFFLAQLSKWLNAFNQVWVINIQCAEIFNRNAQRMLGYKGRGFPPRQSQVTSRF